MKKKIEETAYNLSIFTRAYANIDEVIKELNELKSEGFTEIKVDSYDDNYSEDCCGGCYCSIQFLVRK